MDGRVQGQRDGGGVDEFRGVEADAFRAEEAAVGLAREDFHVAAPGFHEDGFAVVVEGIGRGDVGNLAFLQLFFGKSGVGDLRVGENNFNQMVFVDGSGGFPEGVARGGFPLQDGDVNNLVRAGAIACGVDGRVGGALKFIRLDMPGILEFNPHKFEPKISSCRLATQGDEERRSPASNAVSALSEAYLDSAFWQRQNFFNVSFGENMHAVIAQGFFHHLGGSGTGLLKHMATALDDGDLAADALEELRELAGHYATAEHDDGFWNMGQIQHIVAGKGFDFVQARYRRVGNDGAGSDEEMFAGQNSTIGKGDFARAGEARRLAK